MDEQDLNSVEQEIAPQETEHNESQQDANQNAESAKRVEEQERNWRAMRQRQREMELELKQKNELLDRFLQTQKVQAPQEIAEPEEPDEEYVPAGKVKGIAKRTVQPLEKKINDLEAKLAQHEQEKKLAHLHKLYPDFDDVVNVETLEMLEKSKPGLAATIAKLDPYDMGIQAYEFIKTFGLVEKLPENRRAKEVTQKIEKNAKSVQSPMAYDKRPMAQAFKSTQADKTRLYEEMMFYANKASGL